jgi:CubicO group peptidase (beta-lactamase class C family)
LVSTLPDMLALLRSLLPGGPTLLKPDTIALMMANQLPDGVCVGFAGLGQVPGKVFGLGGALTVQPSSIDPPGSAGEFEWGGAAGTHWWISPAHNLAGLLMTQRQLAFWHPFSFEFKRLVYQAVGRKRGARPA